MDRFLSKRPTLEQSASQPPCKKPKPAAKQGKVSALVRVAESGSDKFFALLIKSQVFVFHYIVPGTRCCRGLYRASHVDSTSRRLSGSTVELDVSKDVLEAVL